jgi:3-dehydroquinate synthase/3-phosphoshikimate 1-carboxyvinyltransferase
VLVLPPGEGSKTVANVENLWNAFAAAGLNRESVVIAYGGGVVGDITGFAAAAYMRGVAYIQVATTLVAQIDSSVGGKTAVNLAAGKNLAGAFWQPEAVICDTDFLETLPERELKAGFAEAVKYQLITPNAPPEFLRDTERMVEFCVAAKAALVEQDELDTGVRMFLNFGHTFGHAIEKKFNYERFNHGEAVAKGMALALRAGVKLGVTPPMACDAALEIISGAGLDASLDFDARELIPLMSGDKKSNSGGLRLVLLKEIGEPCVVPVKRVSRFPSGEVRLPPSKSVLHRELICGFLSGRLAKPEGYISDDIDATVRCLDALGEGGSVLNCGESGTTLRFMIPVAAALGRSVTFIGRGRLMSRPLMPLLEQLEANGMCCELSGESLKISGRLRSGDFTLPGDVSSQYVSGLLLALPLVGGGTIRLSSPLESRGYVELTAETMARYGVRVTESERSYCVPSAEYISAEYAETEADWSQAAFFLAAQALGRDLRIANLNYASKQADRAIAAIIEGSCVNGRILPTTIDVSGIPDLVPPLAALFCFADGTTRFTNASRLRLKESDRLESVSEALNALGGSVEVVGDELVISGVKRLRSGAVNPHGDHRIAMMAAVAAIRCDGDVWIADYDCVRKSYPNFWKDFEVSE